MANTWTNFYPTLFSDIAYFAMTKATVALQVTNLTWVNPGGNAMAVRVPKFSYVETSARIEDVSSLVDTPNDVTESSEVISLDRHKGFFYQVPYIEQDKANVDLGQGLLRQHSAALGSVIDADVLATVSGFTNVLSGQANKATIVSAITILNSGNAPQTDRVLVCGPEAYSDLLNTSDFVRSDSIYGADINRTGYVGMVLGFEVFLSNNLPTGVDAVAMHKYAVALAMLRAVQVRIFDQPRHFNTGYSGRAVWGRVLMDSTLGVKIDRP